MNPQEDHTHPPEEEKQITTHKNDAQNDKDDNEKGNLLPITSAVVHHPFVKEKMFSNYMVYKINFKFNQADQEVNRRYSDFDSLRKAIKMYRPFNYVYPVHRKQFIVT